MNTKRRLEIMMQIDRANARHIAEWKKAQQEGKMLAVFVDVYGRGNVRTVRVKDDLDEFYRRLDCNTIDMPTRWIGGQEFVIICDDEGLFREDRKVSARNGRDVMLFGNLLVVKYAGEGEIRGLTPDEVAHVMRHVSGIGRYTEDGRMDIWGVLSDVTFGMED